MRLYTNFDLQHGARTNIDHLRDVKEEHLYTVQHRSTYTHALILFHLTPPPPPPISVIIISSNFNVPQNSF